MRAGGLQQSKRRWITHYIVGIHRPLLAWILRGHRPDFTLLSDPAVLGRVFEQLYPNIDHRTCIVLNKIDFDLDHGICTTLSDQPLTPDQAAEIHPRLKGGLLITAVEQDSPADQARFRRGHLIVQIGNYFPEDLEEVALLLERLERGQKALFRVLEVRRWSIWVLQGELVAR